ncbi:MAG: S1 RNA-binding domain-containing protein [Desulfitobacterium hafniense]|nr:S1 RNA-binding domain-containing protein [Desulfitobacterium hafniense]
MKKIKENEINLEEEQVVNTEPERIEEMETELVAVDDVEDDEEINAILDSKSDIELLQEELSQEVAESDESDLEPVNPATEEKAVPKAEKKKKATRKKTKEDAVDLSHVSDDTWMMLYAAWRNNTPLEGYQGLSIDIVGTQKCLITYIPDPINGVKCILPEKVAGLRKNEKLESLLSYPSLRFNVIQIDRENGIVVLDRKTAEEITFAKTWRTVEVGDVVEAMVMGVDRDDNGHVYKVFCDVGGVRAILPVSEISHNYMESIDFSRGDKMKVKILNKRDAEDPETHERKRSLLVSVKATMRDPWEIEHCIPIVKSPYNGVIVKKVQTGMFVMLPTGIMVKTPHFSPNYNGKHNEGDTITIYPALIDRETRRVYARLTHRDAENFIRRYEVSRKRRLAARNKAIARRNPEVAQG